ncbi:PhnD/SsuA/transferrin family substrate-binding protein [Rubripirellula obstinata]|uniref:PhnD/SsuA/transferrin family substrate-binding protein n=1 Tax=Rubripirellula obstinata TaxID=406547 RepID=UPI00082E77E4|nr:PhnD/SsuA/transferrin family substrate-binding protein [Rubripirellula obstinata]
MARLSLTIASLLIIGDALQTAQAAESNSALSLVVMDPLAAPLSCPCVEGYAQRDYTVLAKYLESTLGRPVMVTFHGSLSSAISKNDGKADIVIGKRSVVVADAASAKISLTPISRLSDQQGGTDQYGMIVVNQKDPAQSVADLADYTIIFGPSEAEEKHNAAIELLQDAGVMIPLVRRSIDEACSDGACKVIDLGPESKTAAVISSYAQPLLEGCGTIKKGDLRVVGKTEPVPFITVFIADSVDVATQTKLRGAFGNAALDPELLTALESLAGFLPVETPVVTAKKK